jgi:hypothetical protein
MQKVSKVLIGFVTALALGAVFTPALPAGAAADDDIKGIVTRVHMQEETIFSELTEDPEDNAQRFSEFASALHQASEDIGEVSVSAGLQEKVTDVRVQIDMMASSSAALGAALIAGDEDAYINAAQDFQASVSGLQAAGGAYDQYIASNPLEGADRTYFLWFGLVIVSLVCLVAAIVMVVVTRNQHGTVERGGKQVSLKDTRKMVLIGAAVFVVGAAIPAGQYWWQMNNATGNFEYYIFYWPLIFGGLWFLAGLVQYVSVYAKLKKSGELTRDSKVKAPGSKPKIESSESNEE